MKSLIFIISIFFVCHTASAQIRMNSNSVELNRHKGKMKANAHIDNGILQNREFNDFDYDVFTRQQDSLRLADQLEDYKKRLITIDSLIASNHNYKLEDPYLRFSVTYRENGSVDTFAISLRDYDHFSESINFDTIVQELNLVHLQYVLANAQFVDRQIHRMSAMQVDYIKSELTDMQVKVNYNVSLYASALLTYIHQMLTDNKTKLGITNVNLYENSYEPANADVDTKIFMREKFIRYVYSKI